VKRSEAGRNRPGVRPLAGWSRAAQHTVPKAFVAGCAAAPTHPIALDDLRRQTGLDGPGGSRSEILYSGARQMVPDENDPGHPGLFNSVLQPMAAYPRLLFSHATLSRKTTRNSLSATTSNFGR